MFCVTEIYRYSFHCSPPPDAFQCASRVCACVIEFRERAALASRQTPSRVMNPSLDRGERWFVAHQQKAKENLLATRTKKSKRSSTSCTVYYCGIKEKAPGSAPPFPRPRPRSTPGSVRCCSVPFWSLVLRKHDDTFAPSRLETVPSCLFLPNPISGLHLDEPTPPPPPNHFLSVVRTVFVSERPGLLDYQTVLGRFGPRP